MPHQLIALTGYSRCGKDTAADSLVSIGFQRRCFGDIIKQMVGDAKQSEWKWFRKWINETGRNDGRATSIAKGWASVKLHGVSPFTQDDSEKKVLRPLLEDYGIWRYNEVAERFFSSLPEKCVNSRLCRADEGRMWRAKGGKIVKLVRPGNDAHTEVERAWVKELEDAGLIDHVIENDGDKEKLHRSIIALAS